MIMDYVELIGFLGGLLTMAALLPQVIKTFKTRSTKDISILWTIIYSLGLVLWMVYGFLIGSMPLKVMIAIELALSLSLLMLKIRHG